MAGARLHADLHHAPGADPLSTRLRLVHSPPAGTLQNKGDVTCADGRGLACRIGVQKAECWKAHAGGSVASVWDDVVN